MGWNDRVPDEPPYIPYESAEDRDAYENWQLYLEYCRSALDEQGGGLSSQTIAPGVERPQPQRTAARWGMRELLTRLKKLVCK